MTSITPSTITLRTYQPATDRQALWAIAQDLAAWFDEEALETLEEDLEDSDGFVAEVGGAIQGFLLYHTPASIPAEDRYEIIWLGVSPEVHAQGIGSRLIEKVESFLRDKVGDSLELIVWTMTTEVYEKTRAFYQKHGYGRWYTGVVEYEEEEEERLYLRKRFSTTLKRPPSRRDARKEKRAAKSAEGRET